jgi:hypothetical protein
MRLPAYISMPLLQKMISIITAKPIDYLEKGTEATIIDSINFLSLLKDGISATFDSEIDNQLINENPYIKYLIKNTPIKHDPSHFESVRCNQKELFGKTDKGLFSYFLSTTADSLLKQYQEHSGYSFTSDGEGMNLIFGGQLEHFQKDTPKKWEFAQSFLQPHHSIILTDPYLFSENSISSLVSLFESVAPKNLCNKYHVTLIGNPDPGGKGITEKVKYRIKELRGHVSKLVRSSEVEAHLYRAEEFHDRLIITNNCCIVSGYGVDLISEQRKKFNCETKAKKESSWIAIKPFQKLVINGEEDVYGFRFIKQKVDVIANRIFKSDNPLSSNPLIKLYSNLK